MGTLLLASVLLLGADPSAGWPQFRGPTGDGLAAAQGLPLAWGPEENVAWRTPIPGTGRSSPVVLGDRIWVTTAVEVPAVEATAVKAGGHLSLAVICLHREDGRILYRAEALALERPGPVHPLSSHATPTPVARARGARPPGPRRPPGGRPGDG